MLDTNNAPAGDPPASKTELEAGSVPPPPDPGIAKRHFGSRDRALTGGLGLVLLAVALGAAALPGLLRAGLGFTGLYLVAVFTARYVEHRRGRSVDLGLWMSGAWLVALTLSAALAGVLPLAEGRDPANTLLETSLVPPDLFSRHPFGTDSQALDVLAQLLYGARVSLVVASGAVLIALVIGGLLGIAAGYFRGKNDTAISFVTDTLLAFPAIILLLGLVTILKPTMFNATIALGILGIPGTVRIARAATLAVASREFVVASRTLGAKTPRLVFGEVLPNVLPPLLAYSFISIGFIMVAEASLSFLGLGIQRPNPTWGNLIAQGQATLDTYPWLVVFPSVFLFTTVLSVNYIGQRLQRKWAL